MSGAGAGGGAKFNPFKAAVKKSLFDAAKLGDAMLIDQMLAGGANPDITDEVGATPLMYAINEGNADAVRLLLYYGTEVNNEGPNGWFPLLFAVERKHHGILIDLLLIKELDVNKTLPNGITALHIAAQNNDPRAAELLLARGADVNAETVDGITPFMILAQVDPSKNLSEMKRILQAAIAEAAAPAAAVAVGPNYYPKNMKHKKEGGRRTKRARQTKRRKTRHHAKAH